MSTDLQTDTPPAPRAAPMDGHRAILCHFDSYSTALVFALWPDRSLLWPGPLPEGTPATPVSLPTSPGAGDAVRAAAIATLGLNGDDVLLMPEFDLCLQQPDGTPLQVHLLRFTTFEAPAAAIAPAGGVFKPLPALRGCAPAELLLLREVFNLIIGGGRK